MQNIALPSEHQRGTSGPCGQTETERGKGARERGVAVAVAEAEAEAEAHPTKASLRAALPRSICLQQRVTGC